VSQAVPWWHHMSSLSPKLASCIAVTTLAVLAPSSVAASKPAGHQPRWGALCQRVASPDGSDDNPGTRALPFESASHLVQALRPGETGCLVSGRYRGDVHLIRAGRRKARITLRAAPGAKATICGFVVLLPGAAYWRLAHLSIDGSCSPQNTIQIYADHAMLDHDDVTNRHLGPSCILVGSPRDGAPTGVVLAHNRVHDCGRSGSHWDHGIYASSPRFARITDNYVYANAGFGIHLYADAQSTVVERNVVDASFSESGLVFGGAEKSASSHNLVRQNIFSGNGKYGAKSFWDGPIGVGNALVANCFWRNRYGPFPSSRVGFDPRRNIEANPRFVDAAAHDYRVAPRSRCRKMQPRGHVGP
jgi:copper-binding protein NosD